MRFVSTRDRSGESIDLYTAVRRGLAPDGGLYHPETEPDLGALIGSFGPDMSFVDVAGAMIQALFPAYYDAATARALALRAFPFAPRLVEVEPGIELLELFHGPSAAFKDFGACFLATLLAQSRGDADERVLVLTATSGDTGAAVAQAFGDTPGVDVAILYPDRRVSPLQERQLTVTAPNVQAFRVAGSFDDCQRLVKAAFVDRPLYDRFTLSSANSINVGRLIPQSFYYIYAFAQLSERDQDEIVFVVPSGNYGNLTAGLFAWRWGLPVSSFVAASNANDTVPRYLATGHYDPRPSLRTPANAMDVGDPSNFERMQTMVVGGVAGLGGILNAVVVNDREILNTIEDLWRRHRLLVCPHTATGMYAARRSLANEPGGNAIFVTLATASPAKFPEVVVEACGQTPPPPPSIARLDPKRAQSISVAPDLDALRDRLTERFLQ